MHGVGGLPGGLDFDGVDVEGRLSSVRDGGKDYRGHGLPLTQRNDELPWVGFIKMVQVFHKSNGDVFPATVESSITPGLTSAAGVRGQYTVIGRWGVDATHGPSLGRAKQTQMTMSYCKNGDKHQEIPHVCIDMVYCLAKAYGIITLYKFQFLGQVFM